MSTRLWVILGRANSSLHSGGTTVLKWVIFGEKVVGKLKCISYYKAAAFGAQLVLTLLDE